MKFEERFFLIACIVVLLFSVLIGGIVRMDVSTEASVNENVVSELNFTHLNISSESPYYDLVLYMPFDTNTSQTVVYDYSKYHNNGDIMDGAYFNSSGLYGGSMSFDGDGDYINIDDSPSNNFDNRENITVSAWINGRSFLDTDANKKHVVSKPVRGYLLRIQDSQPQFYIYGHTSETWSLAQGISTLGSNQWYHVVGTYNGSFISIYVNGVLEHNQSFVDTIYDSGYSLRIGRDADGLGRFFNGSIDEVMILNASLNASQVLDIYNNQSERFVSMGSQYFEDINITSNESVSFFNVTLDSCQRLYGSNLSVQIGISNGSGYDYNGSVVYFNDSCSANNLTIDGSPLNISLHLNYTAGNSSSLFYSPVVIGNATLTSNDIDNIAPLVTFIYPVQGDLFDLNYSGYLNISLDEAGGNCTLNDSRWNYYSNTTNNFNFINLSEFESNETISVNFSCWDSFGNNGSSVLNFVSNMNSTIPPDVWSPEISFISPTPDNNIQTTNNSFQFNVSVVESNLDRVRFNWDGTNYTLFDNSLVMMYNLDNRSSLMENDTHVVDISGSGGVGVVNNASFVSSGKYGGAYEFLYNDSVIDTNFSKSMFNWTLMAWVKTNRLDRWADNQGYNIVTNDLLGWNEDVLFGINPEGFEDLDGKFVVTHQSSIGNIKTNVSSSQNLSVDTWYHVVASSNGTHLLLYVDGVLAGASAKNGVNLNYGPNNISISDNNSGIRAWNGTIDEVLIWNRSLSSSEIQQFYITGLTKYNISQWYLYVSKTGLGVGNYTYFASAKDENDNLNVIESRILNIVNPVEITLNSPANGSSVVSSSYSVDLSVNVVSNGEGNMNVGFYNGTLGSENSNFSIIVFPDTQMQSLSYPNITTNQTQWVVDNKDDLNIKFVLHEGDFIEDGKNVTQWDSFNASFSLLEDNNISYILSIGNHDYDKESPATVDANRSAIFYKSYYPVSRFSDKDWWGGSQEEDNMNTFMYFNASGDEYMIMQLEFCPNDTSLEWANDTVLNNSDKKVMVITHSYMGNDETRLAGSDTYGCDTYLGAANKNDGEEMWDKFVKHHENIFAVFSGHVIPGTSSRLASLGLNGNNVTQMLFNAQDEPNGGNGWLRILEFDPLENIIMVRTYSPYLNEYSTVDKNQFTIPMNLSGQGSDVIGTSNNLASGSNAVVTWSGLSDGSYDWFVRVYTNESVTSEGWSFDYSYGVDSSGNTGGGGSGGGSSSDSIEVDNFTHYPTRTNLQEGYSKQLSSKKRVSLDIKNQSHLLVMDRFDVVNKTAVIMIFSEPKVRTLVVGEEWRVDLDEDGSEDLLVRLNDVTSEGADIFIQELGAEVFVEDYVEEDSVAFFEDSFDVVVLGYFFLAIVVLGLFGIVFVIVKKAGFFRKGLFKKMFK